MSTANENAMHEYKIVVLVYSALQTELHLLPALKCEEIEGDDLIMVRWIRSMRNEFDIFRIVKGEAIAIQIENTKETD
jgi:hypothetical protein